MAAAVILGSFLAGPVADCFGVTRAMSGSAIGGFVGWLLCLIGWLVEELSMILIGWGIISSLHGGAVYTLACMMGSQAAPSRERTICGLLNLASDGTSILVQFLTAELLSSDRLSYTLPLIASWTGVAALATVALLRVAQIMGLESAAPEGVRQVQLPKS